MVGQEEGYSGYGQTHARAICLSSPRTQIGVRPNYGLDPLVLPNDRWWMNIKLRPWHWFVLTVISILALLLLWFGIAYGGLPRLWSHHEHKRFGRRDEIVSFTAQDIPADPVNLHIRGSSDQITCALVRAGWTRADNVSVRSAIKIAASVVLRRAYPAAPVSSLYVHDRIQDLAFEVDEGKSADKRHHARFWQIGPDDWLGAATFDRGVGLSLFTLQITHYIGSNVDADRNLVGTILKAGGATQIGTQPSRVPPNSWHRNGGGNRYRTDGMIANYDFKRACHTPPKAFSPIGSHDR